MNYQSVKKATYFSKYKISFIVKLNINKKLCN